MLQWNLHVALVINETSLLRKPLYNCCSNFLYLANGVFIRKENFVHVIILAPKRFIFQKFHCTAVCNSHGIYYCRN